ncbi:Rv1733c family protein [Mycobacterium kansasii]
METFTIDPRCWRLARLVGRNPLLRRTDRLEALLLLVVLVASLLLIPAAAIVGAEVLDARDHQYAAQAQVRHPVTATVTGATHDPNSEGIVVHVRWAPAAGERTGSFRHSAPLNVGQRVEIWVDRDGNLVRPPTPRWHAGVDAVVTSVLIVLTCGAAMSLVVGSVRSRLDRARDAAWERDLSCLQDDGGRRNRY